MAENRQAVAKNLVHVAVAAVAAIEEDRIQETGTHNANHNANHNATHNVNHNATHSATPNVIHNVTPATIAVAGRK